MNKFVCIDYELANHHYLSACQLGVVAFFDGVLEYQESYLIKPPQPHAFFIQEFIDIHKIKPDQVKDAPAFIDLWQPLSEVFDDAILCAHHAPFDMKILSTLIKYYHLPMPRLHYFDTVKMAQRIFPFLPNHKLSTVANFLKIKHQHHDAYSDALAASQIVLYAMSAVASSDIVDVCNKLNVELKLLK